MGRGRARFGRAKINRAKTQTVPNRTEPKRAVPYLGKAHSRSQLPRKCCRPGSNKTPPRSKSTARRAMAAAGAGTRTRGVALWSRSDHAPSPSHAPALKPRPSVWSHAPSRLPGPAPFPVCPKSRDFSANWSRWEGAGKEERIWGGFWGVLRGFWEGG